MTKYKERIKGGLASGKRPSDFDPRTLEAGIAVELEHTGNRDLAREIAMDHLVEHPNYYEVLKRAKLNPVMNPKTALATHRFFKVLDKIDAAHTLPELADLIDHAKSFRSPILRDTIVEMAVKRAKRLGIHTCNHRPDTCAAEIIDLAHPQRVLELNPRPAAFILSYYEHPDQPKPTWTGPLEDWLEVNARRVGSWFTSMVRDMKPAGVIIHDFGPGPFKLERVAKRVRIAAGRRVPAVNPVAHSAKEMRRELKRRCAWIAKHGTEIGLERNPTTVARVGDYTIFVNEHFDDHDNVVLYSAQIYDDRGPLGTRWFNETEAGALALAVEEVGVRTEAATSGTRSRVATGLPSPGLTQSRFLDAEAKRRRDSWAAADERERARKAKFGRRSTDQGIEATVGLPVTRKRNATRPKFR